MSLFGRHGREFGRALKRKEWERTPEGIYFPRQRALLHGRITMDTNRGRRVFHNMLLPELVDLITSNLLFAGGAAVCFSSLFIAPFSSSTDIATYVASLAGNLKEYFLWRDLGELGEAPEGYDEPTRPAWVYAEAGHGYIDNSASPAVFTMRTASTISVGGFAIGRQDAKHFGRPYSTGLDGSEPWSANGGLDTFRLLMTNGFYPEIYTNSSGYVPVNANDQGFVGGYEDVPGLGKHINLTGAHAGDPNEAPAQLDYGGGPAGTPATHWFDPSGDDYYDVGSGCWRDPSGDSIAPEPQVALFAAANVPGGPEVFSDMEPMNIIWGVHLE